MLQARRGGVIPVDKPEGPTSHDVVATARRVLGERRIGHTGTLDPFASGLLLLCVGAATRLSEYLTGLDKGYEAMAELGAETDTLDPEGETVARDDAWRDLDAERIRRVLGAFTGERDQVPPVYSAKKVEGERAYRLARRGEAPALEPVRIRVEELELTGVRLPRLGFRLRCSSGTYVRALARDVARDLGTCGHLVELRRTGIGPFTVEEAVPLPALEDPEVVSKAWISPARAVAHLPTLRVHPPEAEELAHGRSITPNGGDGIPEEAPSAAILDGILVAVVEREGSRIHPRKVFVDV